MRTVMGSGGAIGQRHRIGIPFGIGLERAGIFVIFQHQFVQRAATWCLGAYCIHPPMDEDAQLRLRKPIRA